MCVAKNASVEINLYFKTLTVGPAPGIEPTTSRSAVERSTDWVNTAFVNGWNSLTLRVILCCIHRIPCALFLSPRAVVHFSSEAREAREKNKVMQITGPPSFLAASPLAPHACSRSTVTQEKNKRLLAVYLFLLWEKNAMMIYRIQRVVKKYFQLLHTVPVMITCKGSNFWVYGRILCCDHLNETSLLVATHGTVCFRLFSE